MAEKPHPQASFVERLVGDPGAPPDLAVFIGYPGRSSRGEHQRLYLSADLADYLDIPEKAICLSVPVPPAVDPLGAVYLWVYPDAPLTRGRQAAAGLARYFAFDLLRRGPQPQPPSGQAGWQQPTWDPQAGAAYGWQPGQYATQAPYLCGRGGW